MDGQKPIDLTPVVAPCVCEECARLSPAEGCVVCMVQDTLAQTQLALATAVQRTRRAQLAQKIAERRLAEHQNGDQARREKWTAEYQERIRVLVAELRELKGGRAQ